MSASDLPHTAGRASAGRRAVQAGPPRLRLLTLDELLTRPAGEWLVDGVLPRRGLAVLYGPPASFKTFIALDIALSISADVPWSGRPVITGPVVYVIAEGAVEFPKRIRAWLHERDDAQRGAATSQFRCIDQPVRFLDPGTVSDAAREIATLPQKPVLIVIDTLARCIAPGEENDSKDMSQCVAALDELRWQFDAAALVVHHPTREKGSLRGSSALDGAVDTILRTDTRAGVVMVRCEKQKDAAPPAPLCFDVEIVEVDSDADGRSVTSCRLVESGSGAVADPSSPITRGANSPARKPQARESVYDAVRAADRDWVTVAQLVSITDLGQSTVYKAIQQLSAEKLVEWEARSGVRLRDGGAPL